MSKYAEALKTLRYAEAACPHWDYENPTPNHYFACCNKLAAAQEKVDKLKAAHYGAEKVAKPATENFARMS